MAKVNRKAESHMHDKSVRLAGGMGAFPAKQDAEALLRRVVLANLLWENVHYAFLSTLACPPRAGNLQQSDGRHYR